MNKQELIEEIEDLKDLNQLFGNNPGYIKIDTVMGVVSKLDEPEKLVVPQFVSDWYEENKDDFEGNLFRCAHNIPSTFDGAKLNEFERWFLNASIKAFQILVNMHQFGYEVKKEKRYLVKMKGISSNICYLNRVGNKWIIAGINEHTGMNIYTKHTRKQLEEAGFGWVFDCPGIEIEELE